jgi:signal peptidase I
VEKSPLNSAGYDNSLERNIGIIKTVLESGHSVELPATGYSMFPTLRPGDSVVVKPIPAGEFPKPGSVVIYIENKVLVMHRLIAIIDRNDGEPLFITRGDSGIEQDKPWPQQQLLGVAVIYKRAEKGHSVKSFVPGVWRYEYNRRLLWLYNWIKV